MDVFLDIFTLPLYPPGRKEGVWVEVGEGGVFLDCFLEFLEGV